MGVSDVGIDGATQFPPTSWSAIRHASDPGSPEYARHLEALIRRYWRPVYCLIRFGWRRDADDAKDLTQEFFADVVLDRALLASSAPERGSFRGLVRTAVTRFMHNVVRDAGRRKRGGAAHVLSLSEVDLERLEAPANVDSPEAIFDAAWNRGVLADAVERLRTSFVETGRATAFEAFRLHDLASDEPAPTYAAIGEALSLSVPQVKHALRLARAELHRIVTEIVREYVADPDEMEPELRALLGGEHG